ncbi:MAG: S41 family peptidase [Candidatus Acidiferrales bacterium]
MKIARAGMLTTALILGLACGVLAQQPFLSPPAANDSNNRDIQASLKRFSEVFGVVEKNYAVQVDPNLAIYGPSGSNKLGAIPAMLRSLDPHSNFFDPKRFAQLEEEMQGKYYGVGMQIGPLPSKTGKMVTVVEMPLPDSPAFRAGLRPGDVILAVGGKSTANLDTSQVANLLRGPQGTSVQVTIAREGAAKPLEFTLERQKIMPRSVDTAFLLRPGIAYVHIDTFNETTDTELSADLARLDPGNLNGLVLDLRGNLGGLLQEAVEVSSHFLRKGQLIVYHYGRSSPPQRYYVVNGETGLEYPIVVLVNSNTASAAEIVTGALQDHDRALVMGQRSFGKGLVQTEFPLSDHTMLLLTTARYYTPSGRLIQRDYSGDSLYDYYNHYDPEPLPHSQVRMTDGGREVYGGGGITPDVPVPPRKLNSVETRLTAADVFFDFGRSYLARHKTVPADFTPNRKVLDEFHKFLTSQDTTLTSEEFKANEPFIEEQIRIQLLRTVYGADAASHVAVENDPLVQRATASLTQAKELMVRAQRYMASRGTQ